MKTSLTQEWTPATPMPYVKWSLGYLETYDWCVNGCRPKVDLGKIKGSSVHVLVPGNGYMFTEMEGGRAKIEGVQGPRPWKIFRDCMCPGGVHNGPPENFMDIIIDGETPNWCTTCPISAAQVIFSRLDEEDPRIYPALTKAGTFVQFKGLEYKNMGPKTMFPFMKEFIFIQGGNPDNVNYDSNMGRKALGKLCQAANVSYPESFEIHGDLFKNWRCYQDSIVNDKNFSRRTQSTDIDTCLRALRKITRWMGRGKTERADPEMFTRNQVGQLLALMGRKMGLHEEVNRILDG